MNRSARWPCPPRCRPTRSGPYSPKQSEANTGKAGASFNPRSDARRPRLNSALPGRGNEGRICTIQRKYGAERRWAPDARPPTRPVTTGLQSVQSSADNGPHAKHTRKIQSAMIGFTACAQSFVPSLRFQSGGHSSCAASCQPPTPLEGQVSGGSSP